MQPTVGIVAVVVLGSIASIAGIVDARDLITTVAP